MLNRERARPSAETRARMSAAGKGRVFSEEHRRRIGAAHKGLSKPWGRPRKPKPPPVGRLTGERAPGAKLTWEQVRALRKEAPEFSHSQLGSKYGIKKCQVVNILRGIDWKDPEYIPEAPRKPACGERIANAKLTWEAVHALRAEPLPRHLGTLAEKYGVSKASISLILRGLHWKETDHATTSTK